VPTYDYLCGECGHTFEKMQAMSAKPSRKCPKCKKYKLRRLIGAGGGAIIKGEGSFRPPIEGRPEKIRF
jgi:putative FmdB family regulatory protein